MYLPWKRQKAPARAAGSGVVVGSVRTLMREKRLGKFPELVLQYHRIDRSPSLYLSTAIRECCSIFRKHRCSVTATPDRQDMRNLGVYFESLAYEYTLPKAIKEGYLSPIKALTIPLRST